MDLFDDDDMMSFSSVEPTSTKSTRKLNEEDVENITKKARLVIDMNAARTTTTKSSDDIVELTTPGVKNTATVRGVEADSSEIDYFAGYHEQIVVGSAKPEKPSTADLKTCAMQTCYPPGWDLEDPKNISVAPDRPPAKTYPFTLDPFQQKSIECIEKGESVLVSAHTSAGKTVVAEYAIALSLKSNQRVIYTSPIKALSNQKYRELQEEFHSDNVGLMTGDVTINPNASCLVMTTEILRNMLYRGSEVTREVAWVIFDEIHYMRDRSRGVVWEETIVLLPHKCRFVFLSATIPNASEFALWVAKLHMKPCSVVYTDYRPTPLEHHVFPQGGKGLYLVYDKEGQFRDNNFERALAVLHDTNESIDKGQAKDKKKKDTGKDDVFKIVKMVTDKQLHPAIVFSFSKKDCETHAANMSKLDLCNDDERELISEIFHNAIAALSDDDKKLPQVTNLYPLLKRGIGVHHGGLLPLMKEVTEILFQVGLLKVLFSTETFAMGLNMPTRTVIFTSVFKFDGLVHRPISSGEYIQMSGRAGRRGLDDKGMVIMMMDQQLEANVAKEMITGAADPLHSSFHLGYNMLLNLMRVEGLDPEYMMARSFFQFQRQRAVPHLNNVLNNTHKQLQVYMDVCKQWGTPVAQLTDESKNTDEKQQLVESNIPKPAHYDDIKYSDAVQYTAYESDLRSLLYSLRQITSQPTVIQPFLDAGRLVRVKGHIRQQFNPLVKAVGPDYTNIVTRSDLKTLSLSSELQKAMDNLRAHPSLSQKAQTQASGSSAQVIATNSTPMDTDAVVPPGFTDMNIGPDLEIDWGWGVILSSTKKLIPNICIHGSYTPLKPATNNTRTNTGFNAIVVDVLLPVKKTIVKNQDNQNSNTTNTRGSNNDIYELTHTTEPWKFGESDALPQYIIVPVLLSAIDTVSTVKLKCNAQDKTVKSVTGMTLYKSLQKLYAKSPDMDVTKEEFNYWSSQAGPKLAHPMKNMNLEGGKIENLVQRINTTYKKLVSHPLHTHPKRVEIVSVLSHITSLRGYVKWLEWKLRDVTQDIGLKQTMSGMKRVLRTLGLTTEDDVITGKGHVACELSTCDELLGTELVFNNMFTDLTVAQICALCSCMVFDEPHDDEKPNLTDELAEAYQKLVETGKSVGKIVQDAQLPIDIEKFVSTFNPFLMTAVSAWCDGAKFADICSLTDAFEGTIIRVMRRLEELLRQFSAAADAIGNSELKQKFMDAIQLLKRDIVFAASLYL